ncbi:glycine--tRNA ligase subunit beta [Selenomonas sp. TAMA-11512]|uniref:glycine--tRNA ligase subunit beta n=1 Tax=Selenomonas sp. TAMA-11512 TaxID=3095337 RepID=UPI00308E41B4|nr:glycine--tRNA ligase subunit beta [Selenomonas sp. TAMA-11512]
MSKELLLEIGTEEIPAHAMPGILSDLKTSAQKELEALHLDFLEIETIGTPRRIVLCVKNLDEKQADVSLEKRGPSVAVAFDRDHNPTKAAEGFARGAGIDVSALVERDGYVYALVEEKGKETKDILVELLPRLIGGLHLPNTMRWGSLEYRFLRPIRWIVALFGADVVPFEIADVHAGRISRGHRFLAGDFEVVNAENYEMAAEKAFVIVDPEKRKELIVQGINDVASELGGIADITDDLLEEVLYLVEYPTALAGSFEDKYLALPMEAVVTPMRDHQRYFPVKDAQGKLMAHFITVRNGGKENIEIVQHGNERVLCARLADAQFFFDEDRKKSLEDHLDKLKTVVFQEGLGTLFDKTRRLEILSVMIAAAIGISEEDKKAAVRAAHLAKADLVTGMVAEFTELQGIMGREYARLDNEGDAVAAAIDEHYWPRSAGGALPKTSAGRIVSLADKLDNIVATFSRGKIPTGSQDPFALRRQALGLVLSLIESKTSISLSSLVGKTMDLLSIDTAKQDKLQAEIADFIRLRLKNVLTEAGIRYDVADAVLDDIDDPYHVLERAKAVAKAMEACDFAKIVQAFVRVENLAAKAEADSMDEALFENEEEKELYRAYTSAASAADSLLKEGDYTGTIDALSDLAAPIDTFFDGVMVMAEDVAVRKNRLALLLAIDTLLRKVADFDKLVIS